MARAITNLKGVLGNHLGFARDGETVDAATVGAAVRPDTDPTTNYLSMGCIQSATLNIARNEQEIYCPAADSGIYDLDETFTLSKKLSLEFTLASFNNVIFQMLFGNAAAFDATSGSEVAEAPLDGTGKVRGWWHWRMFKESDQWVDAFLWADGQVSSSPTFGQNVATVGLRLDVLSNALNRVTLYELEYSAA